MSALMITINNAIKKKMKQRCRWKLGGGKGKGSRYKNFYVYAKLADFLRR